MSNWCPTCKQFVKLDIDQNVAMRGLGVSSNTIYFTATVTLGCLRCGTGIRGADYQFAFSHDLIAERPHLFASPDAKADISLCVSSRPVSNSPKNKQRLIRVDTIITAAPTPGIEALKFEISEELLDWEYKDMV